MPSAMTLEHGVKEVPTLIMVARNEGKEVPWDVLRTLKINPDALPRRFHSEHSREGWSLHFHT